MILQRWDTVLSDVKELYFDTIIHDEHLRISLKDGHNNQYELFLRYANVYAYKVSDEEILTDYWNVKKKQIGHSFIVKDSEWCSQIITCNVGEQPQHYVIATWGFCVEILTEENLNMGLANFRVDIF